MLKANSVYYAKNIFIHVCNNGIYLSAMFCFSVIGSRLPMQTRLHDNKTKMTYYYFYHYYFYFWCKIKTYKSYNLFTVYSVANSTLCRINIDAICHSMNQETATTFKGLGMNVWYMLTIICKSEQPRYI